MNRTAFETADPAEPVEPRLSPDGAGPALSGLLEPALDRSGPRPRVRTLVRVGPGGEAALVRAGAVLGARAGDIVTARVPIDALAELLTDPAIRAMEAATALRSTVLPPPPGPDRAGAALSADVAMRLLPANDSANHDAGFDALRRRAGERWEGLAGQGVVLGIYDGGLDLEHEDFLRPDGTTRVLYAWDQSAEGSGPGAVGEHLFEYGVDCTSSTIDAAGCPMVDRVGHGTHVAGTAAGDGSATGLGLPAWRFPGGAPAADLIVVKGADVEHTADRLVDGVAYIFARAEAMGRPAVVNVSITANSGPRDGTTLMEQALDALSGPGRIVVAAAGNLGDHRNTAPIPVVNGPTHARGTSGQGSHAVRIPSYTAAPGAVNDGVLLEMWYEGQDSLTVTVTTPRNEVLSVATGDSATLYGAGGAVAILNALDGPSPLNGDHAVLIGILDLEASRPPDAGRWRIQVSPGPVNAGGVYHLWVIGSTFNSAQRLALEGGTSNRYLVGAPATGDRVLAVGAHVTRHDWLSAGGDSATFPVREALGDIAFFSSPGPRRDGVQKPDVTAPGKMVVSSLARDALLGDVFPGQIEADSVHFALLGTSMASPQVAAAVAIMLQLEPDLTPEEAREALRLSARVDEFVDGALPHPSWGSGKLDAAAAAGRIRPQGLPGAEEAVALSANPIRGDALVISYPEPPRSMAVYTLIAERVRSFTGAEIGPLTTVWPLDTDGGGDVANGVYVLVVELPGERVVRKLMVARP